MRPWSNVKYTSGTAHTAIRSTKHSGISPKEEAETVISDELKTDFCIWCYAKYFTCIDSSDALNNPQAGTIIMYWR